VPRIEPFEKNSGRYEQWFEDHPLAYQAELRAVRRLLPKKGRGMEIGVGTGRFAAPLGINIGVEPSAAMRRRAAARGIHTLPGVAESLPFSADEFDFALMVTTVCFVDDLETSFRECARVLKDHGILIVGLVDRDSPLGRMYEKHRHQSAFYTEATFYSTEEIVAAMRKTGFDDFAFVQTIFHSLDKVQPDEDIRDGYGEGSFVVIKGICTKRNNR